MFFWEIIGQCFSGKSLDNVFSRYVHTFTRNILLDLCCVKYIAQVYKCHVSHSMSRVTQIYTCVLFDSTWIDWRVMRDTHSQKTCLAAPDPDLILDSAIRWGRRRQTAENRYWKTRLYYYYLGKIVMSRLWVLIWAAVFRLGIEIN